MSEYLFKDPDVEKILSEGDLPDPVSDKKPEAKSTPTPKLPGSGTTSPSSRTNWKKKFTDLETEHADMKVHLKAHLLFLEKFMQAIKPYQMFRAVRLDKAGRNKGSPGIAGMFETVMDDIEILQELIK